MGKVLIIAEKPSVGQDIAKVLGCNKKGKGYLENERYIVTWAVGHLIGLKMPGEHDERYKKWNLEDLPMIFQIDDSLKVLPDTAEQFKVVKSLIQSPEVTSLINAGDAGREGYLIQSWIYRMARNRKPVKVLWTSSFTEKALREAFSKLKEDSIFRNLLQEAEARAEGDYLLGINYSRLLTLTRAGGNTTLPYGRCQTPLLYLIVQRDREIEEFVSTPYYNVVAEFKKGYSGILVSCNDDEIKKIDFENREDAEALAAQCSGKDGTIKKFTQTHKRTQPPLLYNLALLQKTMGSRYGFSSDYTLSIAQQLYDKYKVMTYPRTDSQCLSTDLRDEILEHLENCRFGKFQPLIDKISREAVEKVKKDKRYFNDHKVTDHYALIPVDKSTNIAAAYTSMNEDEKKVFDAVVLSFIAIFYPDCEYESTEIITVVEGCDFLSRGKEITNMGFREVLGIEKAGETEQDENADQLLPTLEKGDVVHVEDMRILDKMTKAPSRYTVGSIISLMEKYNIGTSATRAEIISKLIKAKFVELKSNKYFSTGLGRQYIEVVPVELKDAQLTNRFEEQLKQISEGVLSKQAFLTGLETELRKNISIFSENTGEKISRGSDSQSIGKCPKCGKHDLVTLQKGFVCPDKEHCGFALWKKTKYFNNELVISEAKAKALIKGGHASFKLTAKSGNTYEGYLKLSIGEKYTGFVADGYKNSGGTKGGSGGRSGSGADVSSRVYFQAPYADRDRIKAIGGAAWDPGKKMWYINKEDSQKFKQWVKA